jgi:actin-like ATPase involved in cell morphogenesis/chorismate mutase
VDSLSPIIGIDFGTTNSKMAWYNSKTNQAEILRNAEGEEQTPSVVYFGESETLVGTPAEAMLENEQERERVIISIKRELVTTPIIALPDRSVKPVAVAAEILHKLKRDAEELHFQQEVTHVVITCPASFRLLEQDKIREAAQSAGFDEVELLEEPVAAAIAYTQRGLKVGKNVLVYDLGGGTFDLAVLVCEENGSFRLALEPQGIKRCGGDDFDEALYNYCDAIAREKLGRAISRTEEKRDLNFLQECRKRKENLSKSERHMFNSLLSGDIIFRHEITRATFESLISKIVEETVRKTKMLLEQASAERQAVETVVLIGGSSRVPLVRRLLEEGLPLKPLLWEKQDIAVALGASYRAYSLWKPGNQYRKAVAVAWIDKKLDEIKIAQLTTLANDLGLTEDQAADIEREVMGETKEEIFSQQKAFEQYHLAVEVAWAERRLDEAKAEQLKALANRLGLTEDQAADIEREVMGETKEAIFAHQVAYRKAVEEAWADQKLNRQKIAQLYTLAARLNLSDNQVDTIELAVMGEIKEALFAHQIVLEQYREAVVDAWVSRKLEKQKIERLTALAKELALSKEQVAQIEREVMGQPKEVLFSKTRLLSVLQMFERLDRLYVSPNIPSNKLTNAISSCNVPQSDEILGLIDCTLWGSATNCILFGTEGIYYRGLWGSPGKIPYSELSAFPISVSDIMGIMSVNAGNGKSISAGSGYVSAEELRDMLYAIKRLL